jgi:hypothetical protein
MSSVSPASRRAGLPPVMCQLGLARPWPWHGPGDRRRRWLPRNRDIDQLSDHDIQRSSSPLISRPEDASVSRHRSGHPRQTWKRRPNPLLLTPLHFTPEFTDGTWR